MACPQRRAPRELSCIFILICGLFLVPQLWAQGEGSDIRELLKDEILPSALPEFQVRQYIIQNTVPLPTAPATSEQWTAAAERLRGHLLEVIFHGWPKEWTESAPRFEEAGVVDTDEGYRIRKLRYEIVPDFEASALLYEPEHTTGKVPAVLNLAGHDGPMGYAYEFKQKRCVSYARHGILALNLEWFGFGELSKPGNDHWSAAHLDFVGANGLGIFYLAMRRGLDYLYNDPRVDRDRIGVTGLSGGGWQTIVLSSLDQRVKAANPVAGFSSLRVSKSRNMAIWAISSNREQTSCKGPTTPTSSLSWRRGQRCSLTTARTTAAFAPCW